MVSVITSKEYSFVADFKRASAHLEVVNFGFQPFNICRFRVSVPIQKRRRWVDAIQFPILEYMVVLASLSYILSIFIESSQLFFFQWQTDFFTSRFL